MPNYYVILLINQFAKPCIRYVYLSKTKSMAKTISIPFNQQTAETLTSNQAKAELFAIKYHLEQKGLTNLYNLCNAGQPEPIDKKAFNHFIHGHACNAKLLERMREVYEQYK